MIAPYGAWPSPLAATMLAASTVRLGQVTLDGNNVYWIETRAAERGRSALMRWNGSGTVEVSPPGADVRSAVHEYGGGAYVADRDVVCFSDFRDGRAYLLRPGATAPVPLTPPGPCRYADFAVDRRRRQVVAVREQHGPSVVNTLVTLPLDGPPHPGQVIASGDDFYSTPRLSPDGSRMSWLSWRHPRMPWDGTELHLAELDSGGRVRSSRVVAGGTDESVFQPGWTADGTLVFVSDRTNWWNVYRLGDDGRVTAIMPVEADCGRPQWLLGMTTWADAGEGHLLVAVNRDGRWSLCRVSVATGTASAVAPGFAPGEWVAGNSEHAAFVAGSPSEPDAIVRWVPSTGACEVLRRATSVVLDREDVSPAESFTFITDDGSRVHAFFYAPRNAQHAAAPGEKPPLIVVGHGGPTAAARSTLDLGIQFWTTRGFAVADVNYRGSTGFGRAYRDALKGAWGVRDVSDCVAAARALAAEGRVDGARLAIRGASAGGYTALAALAFHPGVFGAAASYYGISDIEVLAHDTHKFEARYLDTLIGPYPAARDVYRARSPIYFVDRLDCPLILFQGMDDRVVPPNQAETLAAAVRAKGLPVELLLFEGEQHGFRRAETIVRCLEAELAFYGRVFGFTPDPGTGVLSGGPRSPRP